MTDLMPIIYALIAVIVVLVIGLVYKLDKNHENTYYKKKYYDLTRSIAKNGWVIIPDRLPNGRFKKRGDK